MGVLGWVARRITSPVRIIKDVAHGDFRGAVGEIGDNAKLAGVAAGATGVGLPIAVGLGAAGGAASKWGHGESNIGKIALGGVEGGAEGAAAVGANELLSGGLPSIGGGGALPDSGSAIDSATGAVKAAESFTPIASSGGIPSAVSIPSLVKAPKPRVMSKLGALAGKNVAPIASVAGESFQALEQGNADAGRLALATRTQDFNEEESKRRQKLAELTQMMQGYEAYRPQFSRIT